MDQMPKVVPMRLIATWEVDNTSASCVPRLCSLSLNRLTIFHALDRDIHSIAIAVKLHGYKRTLRSNDIAVRSVNGIVDIDLDLSFTLQYPHFVKKATNKLVIMVQRRKKYKSRPMLGYKTLASGCINLTQVLQSGSIRELALYSDDKEAASCNGKPAARLYIFSLSSQPVEQDDFRSKRVIGDQTPDNSEEDGEEWTGNDDEEVGTSDSDCAPDDQGTVSVPSSISWSRLSSIIHNPPNSSVRLAMQQKKLKQKFAGLLKKFKVVEDDEVAENNYDDKKPSRQDLESLFEELESLNGQSDAEIENDAVSVASIPKPSLRTYFPSVDKLPPPTQDDGQEDGKDTLLGRKAIA